MLHITRHSEVVRKLLSFCANFAAPASVSACWSCLRGGRQTRRWSRKRKTLLYSRFQSNNGLILCHSTFNRRNRRARPLNSSCSLGAENGGAQRQRDDDPGPSFPVNTGERAPPSAAVPEQRGSPLLSSLLPLHRVPSPCAVIKTTGGTRNTAWLLPACNRHHLVHRRGFLFISFPTAALPAPNRQGLKHQRLGSLIGPQRDRRRAGIRSTVL